ncbi:HEPN domain-containing protein [Acinetobacter sp. ANC 4641]|uniref:HEPN domain-containing protein n=1 Tax=Acinetobacter sp. ANC 4641 TaxID=2529847 RepID=UPI0010400FAC|nr:HEPN domain-containing protein [Acinetobacter sp. ANC 4641]TCB09607.1 hypothetical protein E0H78_10785 [Acinetobacter sp. ANC 4641]
MLDPNQLLELNKEYTFNVKVRDGNQLLAGELFLSPKECTLLIMSERGLTNISYDSEYIECFDFQHNFILFELSINNLESIALNNTNHLKCNFKIGFIVCSRGKNLKPTENIINSFTIDSPALNKWLIYTKLQHKLLNPFSIHEVDPYQPIIEFNQSLKNYGDLYLSYKIKIYSDPDTFQAGIKIPPRLRISFENLISTNTISKEIDKIYNLMTLFFDSDFDINTIEISELYSGASMICVYSSKFHKNINIKSPLLPLALNLNHAFANLKEIPLESFNNYYQLSNADQLLFVRYLRYKRMKSDEEKFLGYFRLLEKLTYKKKPYVDENLLNEILKRSRSYLAKKLGKKNSEIKDLASRVMKVNESKYNTTKCLEDFYSSIPAEIQQFLSFQKSDISTICTLRNDITHANEYRLDDALLHNYTKFINALLFLALTQKIGIPFDVCIPVARNLERV